MKTLTKELLFTCSKISVGPSLLVRGRSLWDGYYPILGKIVIQSCHIWLHQLLSLTIMDKSVELQIVLCIWIKTPFLFFCPPPPQKKKNCKTLCECLFVCKVEKGGRGEFSPRKRLSQQVLSMIEGANHDLWKTLVELRGHNVRSVQSDVNLIMQL